MSFPPLECQLPQVKTPLIRRIPNPDSIELGRDSPCRRALAKTCGARWQDSYRFQLRNCVPVSHDAHDCADIIGATCRFRTRGKCSPAVRLTPVPAITALPCAVYKAMPLPSLRAHATMRVELGLHWFVRCICRVYRTAENGLEVCTFVRSSLHGPIRSV